MKRLATTAALAVSAAALLSGGCYSDRWKARYGELLGVAEDGAVLEVSGRDEEAERLRREFLEKLAAEDPEPYRINAGDRIQIRVYGEEELEIDTRIGPDGTVGMMFVGQTSLAGLTIAEARDELERALSAYIKHPVVGLALLEVASETVTVSGSAARPGLYNISDSTRLADVYAQAGGSAERLFNGVDVDVADLENSILVRDGKVLPVDFRAAIERGEPLDNVRMRRGDYVFIAQRMESSVTICGEVKNPHKRLYEAGMGLIEALTTAGWMLDSHWSHVILIRNGLSDPKMYKIDVDGILAGKCRNIRLQPNDIVYVPKDDLSEYNVFVRKLLPTAELVNLVIGRTASIVQ